MVVQETFIQTGPQSYASQHLLVLEDALGGGWHAEVVSDPVDTTGIGLEGQPDLAVGPKGDIAVAWRFPTLDPRGLPATVRHRLADGRWLDARTWAGTPPSRCLPSTREVGCVPCGRRASGTATMSTAATR